jgi:hypothetical protein
MDNTELVSFAHKMDATAAECLDGIQKVIEGGKDGLMELPETDILEAFGNLHIVIEMQKMFIKKLLEQHLEVVDELTIRLERLEEDEG